MKASGDRFLGWRTPWGTLLLQSERDHHEPKVYYPVWPAGDADRPELPDATDRRCPRVVARVERWLTSLGATVVRIPFSDPVMKAGHGGTRDGAGRPSKGADARSVKVPVFLTPAEAAHLDEQRGALTRSEWLARSLRAPANL